MIAVYFGRVELVKLLLASGANANIENADGNTVLMDSIHSRNIQIVKLILAQGADISYKTKKEGIMALEHARRKNASSEIIKLLEANMLAKKIQIPEDKTSKLPAQELALVNDALLELQQIVPDGDAGRKELAEKLEEALVKVKAGEATMNTPCALVKVYDMTCSPFPLECAAILGSWDLMEKFKKLGATVENRTNLSQVAAFASLNEKETDVFKCLVNSGLVDETMIYLYGNNVFIWASVVGASPETIQCMLNNGYNINVKNQFDKTSLIEAVYYKRSEIIRLLLKNNADVLIVTKDGMTALSTAKEHNASPEIIKLLEEAQVRQKEASSPEE